MDKLQKLALSDEMELIFSMDTHEENYLSTQEGKNLPVEHCIKDTHGWQISEALADFAKQAKAVVEKPTFGSMELIKCLDGVDEVELVGLCTDICVISNAMLIKAAYPETVVSVDSACCAGGLQLHSLSGYCGRVANKYPGMAGQTQAEEYSKCHK